MSWENILKKPKFFNRVVNEINNNTEWRTGTTDPQRGHGGMIEFTEKDENEKHEDEPHKLFPPSSPRNKDQYVKVKLPKKLRDISSGRGRQGQTFSLSIADLIPQLKEILKTWETKEYSSDEARWKEYHQDIEKLVSNVRTPRSAFLSRD